MGRTLNDLDENAYHAGLKHTAFSMLKPCNDLEATATHGAKLLLSRKELI